MYRKFTIESHSSISKKEGRISAYYNCKESGRCACYNENCETGKYCQLEVEIDEEIKKESIEKTRKIAQEAKENRPSLSERFRRLFSPKKESQSHIFPNGSGVYPLMSYYGACEGKGDGKVVLQSYYVPEDDITQSIIYKTIDKYTVEKQNGTA